jgi:type II secretory pathway component PulM
MMAWWLARSARERQVLSVAVLLAVFLLGWAWVWDPLQTSLREARARVVASETALARMQAQADEFRRLAAQSPVAVNAAPGSLLVRVDGSLTEAGIGSSVVRVDPLESGRVRVQFQGVDFDALMRWAEALAARDGLRVAEFGAQRVSAARVDARLVLEQPEN